jgi:hypothetical protein
MDDRNSGANLSRPEKSTITTVPLKPMPRSYTPIRPSPTSHRSLRLWFKEGLIAIFLPVGFPDSVTDDFVK